MMLCLCQYCSTLAGLGGSAAPWPQAGPQGGLRSCCKIIYFRRPTACGGAKIAPVMACDNRLAVPPKLPARSRAIPSTSFMADKPQSNDAAPPPAPGTPAAGTPAVGTPAVQRRGSGHRGADMRDTVAEMAERAQLISQEAGSKVAAAMKDVISAGAGIAGFAIESARDLVQYMVRRGQMTPEEADKLIKEAEAAH